MRRPGRLRKLRQANRVMKRLRLLEAFLLAFDAFSRSDEIIDSPEYDKMHEARNALRPKHAKEGT